MPKRRRRSFTLQFKAQVVLEVLSGLVPGTPYLTPRPPNGAGFPTRQPQDSPSIMAHGVPRTRNPRTMTRR
jgi:hypothetical protein